MEILSCLTVRHQTQGGKGKLDPYGSILIHVNPSHGFVKNVFRYQVRLKGGKEAFTWREIKEGMTQGDAG